MWSALTDNLLSGVAVLTALAGLAGAWLKFKPRPRQAIYRVAGFFSVAKEREISAKSAADWKTRAEYEATWGLYWKAQAQQCIKQFQEVMQADAEHETGSPAGGGATFSPSEDTPTPMQRLTG